MQRSLSSMPVYCLRQENLEEVMQRKYGYYAIKPTKQTNKKTRQILSGSLLSRQFPEHLSVTNISMDGRMTH